MVKSIILQCEKIRNISVLDSTFRIWFKNKAILVREDEDGNIIIRCEQGLTITPESSKQIGINIKDSKLQDAYLPTLAHHSPKTSEK